MRETYIKTSRGYRWPFSKGLLVESLLNAGVKMQVAQSIAHTIEELLRSRKRSEISANTLKRLLTREVERVLGPEVAARLKSQTQSFEEIVVKSGDTRRPFSKGVLARSLEDAGFSTREAYELAKDAETALRKDGVREIDSADLEKRVGRLVEKQFGRTARRRYTGRLWLAGELFVEEEPGEPRVPFSKGVLAQSIMAAGVSPDAAYRITREIERRLREANQRVVSRDQLREVVSGLLAEEVGEDLARKYELLRAIRRTVRPVHLLIGGVTGVGKSLLGSALAYRLGITRLISTDTVREILRSTVATDLIPTLHTSSFDAWTRLAGAEGAAPSPELILRGFRDQVARVAVGLRAIQERSAQEHTSVVVEGVHVVPGYLSHPSQSQVIQIPMLMMLEDEEMHRSRFTLRERETQGNRPRGDYLRNFASIRLIQNHLLELAQQTGIPVIPGENLDRAIDRGLEVIVERMQKVYGEVLEAV
ncbi:MAG TPA: ATP cone domain-containing protein [Meiothermus sp.]|jgi:2-phosphoglycerate kinase|nr:ATP cone domain-containing protein [Meiothermus sp.]